MAISNLRSILSGWRKPRNDYLRLQIGDIVKSHGPVYARVIPWQDFIEGNKSKNETGYYDSIRKAVDRGEWVCLETSSGVYLTIPASALDKVNPRQELLEQKAAIRYIDTLFLEEAIGNDES
ncbi:hypothetical protein J4448_06650 [Candidatus Woesearchaeota archaeon]|nr:hypothetical protein [Candidatus Woesearchaeota archaeon]